MIEALGAIPGPFSLPVDGVQWAVDGGQWTVHGGRCGLLRSAQATRSRCAAAWL